VHATTFALLALAAFAAGWVDAIAGGGGLIQLPALLLGLPAAAPAAILGTNKCSSIIGTTAAMLTYRRRLPDAIRAAAPMAAVALVGAACGALIATHIPKSVFIPLIVVALVAVALWTWFRPPVHEVGTPVPPGRASAIRYGGGAAIGLYDGSFGPGTGSFLITMLVAGLHISYVRASAMAKVVNLATNAGALTVFALGGHVMWLLGLAMGACNLVGAVLGAWTALNRGSSVVRLVLVVFSLALAARLIYGLVAS
jgi:uncharacterized membrane protein YfcA